MGVFADLDSWSTQAESSTDPLWLPGLGRDPAVLDVPVVVLPGRLLAGAEVLLPRPQRHSLHAPAAVRPRERISLSLSLSLSLSPSPCLSVCLSLAVSSLKEESLKRSRVKHRSVRLNHAISHPQIRVGGRGVGAGDEGAPGGDPAQAQGQLLHRGEQAYRSAMIAKPPGGVYRNVPS
jgi:hypothetical protein